MENKIKVSSHYAGDEEMAKFFLQFARRAKNISREWGVMILPPLCTERLSVKETAAAMISNVDSILVK